MKKVLLLLLVNSMVLLASAQEQLLNGSFETWEKNILFENDELTDWWGISMNCTGQGTTEDPTTCETTTIKSTDAYAGTYAAKLKNIESTDQDNPISEGKLLYYNDKLEEYPFTSKPTSLTGYYKFNNAGSDKITINVFLYGENTNTDIVGFGSLNLAESKSVYTKFTVPINYSKTTQPQHISVSILFNDDASLSSDFTVDNLLFTYPATAIHGSTPSSAGIQFYPNPGKNEIHFEKSVSNISISTSNGQTVLQHVSETSELNIESLQKGIYIISYEHKGSLIHGKLVVED